MIVLVEPSNAGKILWGVQPAQPPFELQKLILRVKTACTQKVPFR